MSDTVRDPAVQNGTAAAPVLARDDRAMRHPRPEAPGRVSRRPGLILAVVLTGQFMALLDVSIANVAAPTIGTDLRASGTGLQFVIAAYTIVYAVLLITGARLGERHGYRRIFRIGLALFTIASLACGLAPGVPELITARLVQGAGAALMVPQVLSLIQRSFTGSARVRAVGAYTAVLASGMVVGQVVGGLLVSANLLGTGWRPVFLVNVPIGVALLVVSARLLPALDSESPRHLDPAGLVLLSAAVFLLVLPLVLGRDYDWPWWGWVMLAGSAITFGAFIAVQRRIADRGGSPLIHHRVVTAPSLAPSAAAIFLMMTTVGGFLFALTLHLQAGLGDSALRAGLTFSPLALGFGFSGLYWGRLPQRLHRGLPLAALGLAVPGYLLVAAMLRHGAQPGPAAEVLLLGLGLIGGCTYGPLFASAIHRVDPRYAADASGLLVTVIQLGQVVGVATLGTLFLDSVSGPGPAASGRAVSITASAVAVLMLAAAGFAALRPRPMAPSRV